MGNDFVAVDSQGHLLLFGMGTSQPYEKVSIQYHTIKICSFLEVVCTVCVCPCICTFYARFVFIHPC